MTPLSTTCPVEAMHIFQEGPGSIHDCSAVSFGSFDSISEQRVSTKLCNQADTRSENNVSARTPATTMASPTPPAATPSAPATPPYPVPPHTAFPPFYTLQPNPLTRSAQLATWSALVLAHCAHHRLFALTPRAAAAAPPFASRSLARALAPRDVAAVLDWMASAEGGFRAEWRDDDAAARRAREAARCWVYWRRPEEWAAAVEAWVEATGRRGSVLTLYEIAEGDAAASQGGTLVTFGAC
jgi:ESCRT-II complex subunit VPS25